MYQSENMSFENTDFEHLLQRREFGRFSDPKHRRNDNLNNVLRALVSPALAYEIKKIERIEKNTVYLENEISFSTSILAKVLEHCKEMVFFIVTIGSAVENEAARLNNDGRLTESYILDRLGSLTAEYIVNTFCNNMKRHYKNKGFGTTLRFSPGYCDWQITEQKKLFLLLDTERVGVTLTESCLMHPRKSISGVFGLFPLTNRGAIPPYNPCLHCRKTECNGRRYTVA